MKFDKKQVKARQDNLVTTKYRKASRIVAKVFKYIFLVILAVLIIAGVTALGALKGVIDSTPDIESVNVLPTMYPSVILDSEGNQLVELAMAGAKRTEATLDEVPDALKWSFIDLEDERFYEHNGIDLRGIIRAAFVTLTEDRKEGASTITQQLLKNNVFETGGFERSTGSLIRRKIQEQVLALELEKKMSKDEILITYLNTINLGAGNYGVKEAAKYYFNKDLSKLTVSECAVIAAITQNPSGNNPARFPENNQKRARTALENMRKYGHITEEEYQQAINDNVYDRVSAAAAKSAESSPYSYFVDALIEQVLEKLQEDAGYTYAQAYNALYSGGLTIYSTQDSGAQKIVEEELNDPENYESIDTTYCISWDMSVKHADGTMDYFWQANITDYHREELGEEDYYLDFDSKEEADADVEEFKAHVLKAGDEVVYENIFYTLQPQASFTLMDYTNGHVLASVGGRGDKETNLSLNRATSTNRQPGSTFKTVASFAPALDIGAVTLATTFDDAPFSYGGSGKNIANWWGGEYRGLSTIRQGFIDSMNIVACKTLYYIGGSMCIPYLESFGYKSIVEEDANMATAIGGVTWG
ncbi:MAG: transglycosylase domain-containing protein, partial [Parasporobacterium sp.]|nr:transglycosylase domain-containing protein [Parasporobacterium sp.]